MENSLFPTFEIPNVVTADEQEDAVYKPTPLFDFEKGDFVRDGANRVIMADGLQAYRMWVLKALQTQQSACLSYLDIGVDYEGALAETTHSAVQAELERAITEALLMHPMTLRVRDFEFEWNANILSVQFTVQGRGLPAFDARMNVVTG